ncbi:MAG: DUF1285 domain-containing protein [Gammaproteobacteria bacterium]|nr:DUF1285 domain-containing protein [Gammaproteobacteria bacterium]
MDKLQRIAASLATPKVPPVHAWRPEQVGEIDIQIDHNCDWWHEGGLIQRAELVKLFSSILWYEEDQYYLVTPAEKLKIAVADVPFLVQSAQAVDSAWVLTLNTAEQLLPGSEHPVELRLYDSVWVPYVRVRYELWARVGRQTYLQWVEAALESDNGEPLAEPEGSSTLHLYSGEYRFAVARS